MSSQTLMDSVYPEFDIIDTYIKTYGNCDAHYGIKNILIPWSKNKHMLWNLLGQQLIKEVPINIVKTEESLIQDVSKLCTFQSPSGKIIPDFPQKSSFVKEFFVFIENKTSLNIAQLDTLYEIFNATTLAKDQIFNLAGPKVIFAYGDRKVIIQNGMKPMRAIGKLVKLYGEENFPNFSDFQNEHSVIFTSKNIKGTLVLSIHPLDYLTMSDNGNGWTTCMSWMGNDGCYKAGTLELLNSNNVLVAYLKSDNEFQLADGYTWDSKSWRILITITKDIIVTGKSYPYIYDDLSIEVLNRVRELAKENLNWEYYHNPQQYMDMLSIYKPHVVDFRRDNDKHNILFKSRFMYNDMIAAKGVKYWCVRNKVQKQKIISIAGKVHCLDCGDEIYWDSEEEGRDSLICDYCAELYSCHSCGIYLHKGEGYIIEDLKYCSECADRVRICPDCGKVVSYSRKYILPFTKKALNQLINADFKSNELYTNMVKLKSEVDCMSVATCSQCYDEMIDDGRLEQMSKGMYKWFLTDYHDIESGFATKHLWDNWARQIDLETHEKL